MSLVWCVEDDADVREIEVYTLRSTGFKATGFADVASFRQALHTERPELILLDVMLPDGDGVDVLRALRQDPTTARLPVIMATAKGMEYDKIQSLDLGADDYLVKPFGMMEMVSRVRAVLRRCRQEERAVVQCGPLRLHSKEHTAYAHGQPLALTYKEFALLQLFLAHPAVVFSRDELFNAVWGAAYMGETRTVDMHIRTLRRKLGACASMIETVRNVGYRLALPPEQQNKQQNEQQNSKG